MTRKRFVKQLMALGISRNRAGEIARKRSQSRAYADFNGFDLAAVAMAGFGYTAKQVTKSFNRFIRARKKMEYLRGEKA